MNPDYMCIEEEPNPSPFHGKFEADFWESVSQSNKTVNIHFSSQLSTSNFESQANFGQILYHIFQEIQVPTGPSYKTLWSRVSQTP